LGTNVQLSSVFHPQTNEYFERTIQILKDMLRARVIDFGVRWSKYLSLVESPYNNSYQANMVCLRIRLCMDKSVDYLYVGMRLERGD
jgi:hypothetical protein